VLLAEAHTAKDELTEATDVIDEATRAFAGTPEEVDVLVAHARLTLAKGSAEAAVRMLGNVPFGSPAFAKAQQVKADILLRHRRDRRAYIQCFQDVVDRRPASSTARVALSEAYMRISMPEEAVAALSEARAANPFDGALTRRLGRALVRMHDYDRAVGFYHEALRTLDSASASEAGGSGSTSLDAGLVASLRQDLIELLVRQQRFAEAQALIDEELMRSERDAISLRGTRQSLRAMASVQRGVGDAAAAVVTLEQALKVQQTVMSKLRREAPELLPAEQEAAADLCHEVAQAHLSARPPDESQAQRYLADALRSKESHIPSLRALARLLLRRGDVRNAERVVTSLRRADPKSVTAAMLAAELQMADGAVDAAAYQMAELLETNPTHFDALSQSVRLLKLAGRLADAAKMVTAAERAGRSASKEPGLRYCRGLVHRYQNQPSEAIACFNDARHSAVWGVRAVEQMVWLYICPDGDAVWRTAKTTRDDEDEDEEDDGMSGGFGARGGSGGRGGASGSGAAGRPGATSLEEASEVAITLLRGIPRRHWGRQHDVLRAYAVMIRPEPAAKAEAQKVLASIYGSDDKYVPAIAAMATLHLLQGETTKAKNQLKHQARLPLDTDTTEDYVRCRLMLADVQMGAAKNDLAIKMCREALARDNASALASEILGDIAEREMSYADAADHFARAWESDMERTARVGYKLAFNYLKSRRFTRAIDVCHKVLEQFPDYGKIQETIVDVARRSLRS
jgi:tetratricopeptide repeat protein 21B